MSEEEEAYEVLARRFGFSPVYIRHVLEEHFESASDAGRLHGCASRVISPEKPESQGSYTVTVEDVRDLLLHFDKLRTEGILPPLRRVVEMHGLKKDKHGKYYVATEEQLQEELRIQRRSSIDPDGNLVVDGKIVAHHWLQSFSKSPGSPTD